MTLEEAKKIIKSECYIADLLNLDRTRMVNTALDMAIMALGTEQTRIIKCLNTTCAYNDKYKCKSDEIVIDNGGDCMCQEEED